MKTLRHVCLVLMCVWSTGLSAQNADPYMELKVREAMAEGLDSTAECRGAVEEFRHELSSGMLKEETAGSLVPAYDRFVRHTGGTLLHLVRAVKLVSPQATNAEVESARNVMSEVRDVLAGGGSCLSHEADIDTLDVMSGQLPSDVEKTVWALGIDEVSEPVLSYDGVYVVKMLGNETVGLEMFSLEISHGGESTGNISTDFSAECERLKAECGYTQNQNVVDELLKGRAVDDDLFVIGTKVYTVGDFRKFAAAFPGRVSMQFDAFVAKSLFDYRDSVLMKDDPVIERQSDEFMKRYLADKITYLKVDYPSQHDEAGLSAYYDSHRKQYYWVQPKYKCYLVRAKDKKTGKKVVKLVKNALKTGGTLHIEDTLKSNSTVEERIVADPKRDLAYLIPTLEYGYVKYASKKIDGPEDYNEVRDRLTSDYRGFLEAQWLKALSEKYRL